MKFTCTPRVTFKDKALNGSYIDVLQSMEEFRSAKEEFVQSGVALEEINDVALNIEQAIASIEEFGMTVENMSVLNADGSLEDLMNEKISIESFASMSEQSLKSLEGRALESLGETIGKIWDAFVEGVKKVWEAIKRFFVALWNRIRSLFSSDKDFYKKAMAAYDKLHKDPETEKKVDKMVADFKFSDHIMKKFTEVQSLKEKALEDISVTFDANGGPGKEMSIKGSGFFEYSQAKKFVDYVIALDKSTAEQLESVGGPIEYALSRLHKMVSSLKTKTIDEKTVREGYVELCDILEKLPSLKGKLSTATGGILECEQIEVKLNGLQNLVRNGVHLDDLEKLIEMPTFKAKITLRCKEGTLGQLGWDKKKLLDMLDYVTKRFTDPGASESQIERMCNDVETMMSKLKVNTKSDDPEMKKCLQKLRKLIKVHSDWGREYVQFLSKLNAGMVRFRSDLKKIPAFILTHIDVGARMTEFSDKENRTSKKRNKSIMHH